MEVQQKQICCLMLPVVTCHGVAPSDAMRTKNYDIHKWWESLRNISQKVLPEISASGVAAPRENAWSYSISAAMITWGGLRKRLCEKTKMN